MNFRLEEAIEVLERTPEALSVLLSGLSAGWLQENEGPETWNAEEVVAHLIEAEKTNWLPRAETILHGSEPRVFPPFDRFAHLKNRPEETLDQKLRAFQSVRSANIERLRELVGSEEQFERTGIHPEFGEVRLRELLSTWVVHDLTHLTQIARVMAERYRKDVGPWEAYLGVLNRKK